MATRAWLKFQPTKCMSCHYICRVFMAAAWGQNLDLITARAVVVVRLCSLARGYSGVRMPCCSVWSGC